TYPWNDLWTYLNGGNMSGVPQGWLDDGVTLTAPNGHKVVLGFRDHVLSNNWNPDNWPLGEEYGTHQLELSNPALGPVDQQGFRWSMLGYSTSRGVFEEWTGQEIIALRTALARVEAQSDATLQKQIDDLQTRMKQINILTIGGTITTSGS